MFLDPVVDVTKETPIKPGNVFKQNLSVPLYQNPFDGQAYETRNRNQDVLLLKDEEFVVLDIVSEPTGLWAIQVMILGRQTPTIGWFCRSTNMAPYTWTKLT